MYIWVNIDSSKLVPDNKIHGANMPPPGSVGPRWAQVGPMNLQSGMLPVGPKIEPIVASHWWGYVSVTWEQFHCDCQGYRSVW